MKFIQTLISDGMSMNSLKPSINSEPECSLDAGNMKETSVDECILSKEMHVQNNGEKELCLTKYDIGNVGNTTKKMFEQVDLNSSIPSPEVPMKKDTWNPGDLYDNTSEKENMESNAARYDMLSDEDKVSDDDNESLHLKISSEDENSIADSESNEQISSYSKQLDNTSSMLEEDMSQEVANDVENADFHCEVEGQNASNESESSRENLKDSYTSEKDVLQSSNESEEKLSLRIESDHEDTTDESEPMPSCSESSQLSLSTNDDNILNKMVNEEKSAPTSPETLNAKKDSEFLETKIENSNGESSIQIDQTMSPNVTQNESKCDSPLLENLDVSDAQSDGVTGIDDPLKEIKSSTPEHSGIPVSLESDTTNTEKEVILLSDDGNDYDGCVDSSEVRGLQISDQKTDDSDNENLEEETVCSRELEEVESEQKDDGSPERAKLDDSMKEEEEEKFIEDSQQSDLKLLERETLKECVDPEENFLEILEYQPMNEEGEELREIQSDKDIPCAEEEESREIQSDLDISAEIQQKTSLAEKNTTESLDSSELCTEKEIKKNNMLSLVQNDSKDSDHSSPATDTEDFLVNPPETNAANSEIAKHGVVSTEKVGDVKDDRVEEQSVERGLQKLNSSDNEKNCETNNTVDDAEKDSGIKLVSEIASAKKTESLADSCEAQSGRKRTSNSEENLVSCSKRTKVAITETEENEESDVLICEQTTNSDHTKKCIEVDTKEKCDSRAKRLSNSVSDPVEVKKIRVMSDDLQGEKDEIPLRRENEENLEPVRKEKAVNIRKESTLERTPLPFIRTFTHVQLQEMSRSDLEELVLQKMCEAVTERSTCGELRERAQALEEKVKIWQKKSVQLTKQVKDLNLVLKRYGSDLQNKGPHSVPVKITRSVGLQVQMPGVPNTNWNPEESPRRKSEKSSSSAPTSSVSTSVTNSAKVNAETRPAVKPSLSVQKVSDGGDVQAPAAPTRQNSQSTPQSNSVKALQTRSPVSSNSGSVNTNKTSSKPQLSLVNNRAKSSSDLQVIDLTDAEEKTKTNTTRSPAVSNVPPATSAPVPVATTTVASSVSSNAVSNMGIPNMGRSIRVVQHLGGSSAPILTQSGTNAVAGQRVAYFVPSTNVPVQQRQLIISSPSQVRPAGVVSMSQRQNSLPTIVLKPGQVVPVSPVSAGANIIRTSGINSSLQLASPRTQPRAGQIIQRFPVNTNSVQSSALSVVQSSGLSVSSVSHPAPLPPIPPSGPNNANWKLPPPKPDLKISKVPNRNQQGGPSLTSGIVLSWNMTVTHEYEEIASYQLFAYQEGNAPPSTHLWKKVGDVKALPLPMACTLTQFMEGHKYHFAVRAVDVYARYGPFSAPGNIVLTRN